MAVGVEVSGPRASAARRQREMNVTVYVASV